MKILFIGDLRPHARSLQRYKTLIRLGYNVVGIERDIYIKWRNNIIFKGINKLIPYFIDISLLNNRILEFINKNKFNKFNVIWIEKSLALKPSILEELKNIYNAKIVFNTEDDMMQKHNQSIYFFKSLKLFDYLFTTKSYNVEEFKKMGIKNVYFFNNTFDSYFHRPVKLTKEEYEKFKCDVGFIGSFEKERAESLLFLAKNGIKVRIYGNGWKHLKKNNSNLEIMNKPIYGEDLIKSICATKINLNFLRKANRDLQTNRSVEIPACGAFMLAERTKEHLNMFEERKEAEFFASNEELLKKVNFYLKNEQLRQQIGQNGRKRCLSSGYSMKDTLQKMMLIVKGEK
jgi:spore maturation protein CgeB